MTENINFELLKEIRRAGSRMAHPGKHDPSKGMVRGGLKAAPHDGCRRDPEMIRGMRPDGRMGHGNGHDLPRGPEGREGEHGIQRPLPREFVLSLLLDSGNEGIRQKDLAEKLGIRSAAMSEAIDKLEDNGYIERKVDETDRRATLIFLTEKGEARACEVRDQRQHRFDRIFGDLTQEEKEQLLVLLKKMNGSAQKTEMQ